MLEYSEFVARLDLATQRTVEFTRGLVHQPLRAPVRFAIFPNQSFDAELAGDEVRYPEDSLPEGSFRGPWTREESVTFLWRDGRIPEWINISVMHDSESVTLVRLECCGRFTRDDARLYRVFGDTTPFHVVSPPLPPGWHEGVRFDLPHQLHG